MRSKILKLGVTFLTFSLGLGVFYLWYFELIPKNEQKSEIVIQSPDPKKQDSIEDFDPWKLPDDFPPLKEGEFFHVGHGCGNGYVDGWLAYDGSHLSEGFNAISQKEFNKEIEKSGTIIEKTENYPNKDGKKGLRIILRGVSQKTGKEYYSILWFGKWLKKDTGRYFIDAPNLEIALQLEQKLLKDAQRGKEKK